MGDALPGLSLGHRVAMRMGGGENLVDLAAPTRKDAVVAKWIEKAGFYTMASSARVHLAHIADAILKGRQGGYPTDYKLLFLANINYVNQIPNTSKIARALQELEFIVVLEQFMTPTARYADIVLPTNAFLERNDLTSGGIGPFYGYMNSVIDSAGESKSHLEIATELAARLGIADYSGKAEDEWLLTVQAGAEAIGLAWELPDALPDGKYVSMYEVDEFNAPIGGTSLNMAVTENLTVPIGKLRTYIIRYASDLVAAFSFLPGWNLISLPFEPTDPTVYKVLADEFAGRDSAERSRATGRGVIYIGPVWRWVNDTYESVSELHALNGYWVYTLIAVDILVKGAPAERDTRALDLGTGWNLVGFPDHRAPPEHDELYEGWFGWDSIIPAYYAADELFPCSGYWTKARTPFSLPLTRR